MNRRKFTQIALGVGFSGVSADLNGYFDGWEREDLDWGTHYWTRNGRTCFEFKDYHNKKILSIYTIHEVGELDQFLLKTEVESRREAARLIDRICLSRL